MVTPRFLFLISISPYFPQRKFFQRNFHIFFQSVFEKFYSPFAGDFGITVFDLITDSIGRLIFQLTDIQRAETGKFQDYRNRRNHPVSRFFPQSVQKSDGICRDMRSGDSGEPAVMPELIVVIPAQKKFHRRIQLIGMHFDRQNFRRI